MVRPRPRNPDPLKRWTNVPQKTIARVVRRWDFSKSQRSRLVSVRFFRHRTRPGVDPKLQCDAKSQCSLGCYSNCEEAWAYKKNHTDYGYLIEDAKFGADVVSE